MDKKIYSVDVYQINYNTDTSLMKKDYTVFENAYLNGVVELAELMVYEDEGIFKELISGIEVPVMEERIYLSADDSTQFDYHYHLKGSYPAFFFVNIIDESKESPFKLENMIAKEEKIRKYIQFIKRVYSDNKGNYKDSWYKQLERAFMDNLILYGEVLEENGYSDEYMEKYLSNKVYKKEQ